MKNFELFCSLNLLEEQKGKSKNIYIFNFKVITLPMESVFVKEANNFFFRYMTETKIVD